MSAMWDALKSVAVERIRTRANFWLKKEREDLNVHPDVAKVRADECVQIIAILETLKETYEAPIEPVLRSERKGRG